MQDVCSFSLWITACEHFVAAYCGDYQMCSSPCCQCFEFLWRLFDTLLASSAMVLFCDIVCNLLIVRHCIRFHLTPLFPWPKRFFNLAPRDSIQLHKSVLCPFANTRDPWLITHFSIECNLYNIHIYIYINYSIYIRTYRRTVLVEHGSHRHIQTFCHC